MGLFILTIVVFVVSNFFELTGPKTPFEDLLHNSVFFVVASEHVAPSEHDPTSSGDPGHSYHHYPTSTRRHFPLSFKIIFGAPFIPIGFLVSVMALRRRAHGHDPLGFLVFLMGGAMAAVGFVILTG